MRFKDHRPVERGVSIVGKEANAHYKKWSKVRKPKNFYSFADYRRITRKIWKKVALASVEYESGVYAKDFFYIVPQVIDNQPYIIGPDGKIKSNHHTNGDIYTPIYCNLFKRYNHFCWSVDGSFVKSYKQYFKQVIEKYVPKYYFILASLKKNNL